jgi:NifB/MoaA-like Fe-S oxidoreductase
MCRSSAPEFGEKHVIAFRVALTPTPGPDLGKSHAIAHRNSHSCRETLEIIPEIERGEPIPASVGC